MKKAFTLIELIIAISITAVLATISSQIISTIYDNYLQTRSITSLEAQTKQAITQISKRLQYRIKPTLAAYTDKYINISECDNNCALAWYMQSYESRRIADTDKIGWSGVVNSAIINGDETTLNLNNDDENIQDLSKTEDIIKTLTSKENIDKNNPIAIFFSGGDTYDAPKYYDDKMYKAWFHEGNIKTNITDQNKITDQYYLSHTINKIYVDQNSDLILETNFLPWDQTKKISKIMAKNVTTLRFTNFTNTNIIDGYGLILKICIKDPNLKVGKNEDGSDSHLEVCKVKAIL